MEISENYDLVIIGGGPAGTPVAIEYAKLHQDKNIALIDALGELGGECLFQGCIPSKIMEASARQITLLDELKEFGIALEDKHYNLIWGKIKQNKDEILNRRTNAAKDTVNSLNNIDLIKAEASFINESQILLEKGKVITFQKAVIATGSKSFIPEYEGDGVDEIITNSDFFAKMELPNSLSVIGSGAVAVEFSQILASLGVKINMFVRGSTILKNVDVEAREIIENALENNANINVIKNAQIQKVDKEKGQLRISYIQNNTTHQVVCEKLLSAAGRIANIDSLCLEKAGVSFDKKGIIVDKHLQTSNKNIYANGDVAQNFPKFAHTAQYGAHTISQNLFLDHNLFSIDFDKNSWVLFSSPNVASAGLSEDEAKQRGIEVITDTFDFATEAKSQILKEDFGFVKFVVEKSSHVIVGITIVHEQAHSLGGEAALIVSSKLKLKDLINSIHPHPTISESFVMLSKQMMGAIMVEKLKNPLLKTLLDIERWL